MGKARKRARVVSRPPLEPLDSFELAGESRFARALGSCDFHTRERGFQALAAWLASGARVDEASLGKVWKGILFCFWHSDQQPVQKDLAERLARIMRDVSIEVAVLYFAAFMQTMMQNWNRIDRLRVDKFMMLSRVFLHQIVAVLDGLGWEEAATLEVARAIRLHAFHADDAVAPIGFSLHLADIFLAELDAAVAVAVPEAPLGVLMDVFIEALQRTRQPALLHRIRDNVFGALASRLSQKPSKDNAPISEACKLRCDVAALGASLFQAGAEGSVRAHNRAALYALAQRFEQMLSHRSRESSSGAPAKSRDPPANDSEAPSAAQHDGPAAAAQASPSAGQAAARVTSPQESKAARKLAIAARKAKRNKLQDKSAPGDVGGGQPDLTSASSAALSVVMAESAPALSAALAADARQRHDAASLAARAADGDAAAAALSTAVTIAQRAAEKRRISFDLKKNVVCAFGSPLPPPNVRTPPSAKPNGSALKRESSLPPPRRPRAGPLVKGKKRRRSL